MALTVISTNTIVAGTAASLSNSGDDLYVLRNISLITTSGTGISVGATDTTTQIDGIVVATSRGYTSSSVDSRLTIGATGVLQSFQSGSNEGNVVLIGNRGHVSNRGEISAAEAIAVFFGGIDSDLHNTGTIAGTTGVQLSSTATNSDLVNLGTILANNAYDGSIDTFEGRGVVVQASNVSIYNGASGKIISSAVDGSGIMAAVFAGGLTVNNHGQIAATSGVGIDLGSVQAGQSQTRVVNWGTVSGAAEAYVGSVNADTLLNRGLILGNVGMGDGADLFDGRGGRIEGAVDTGLGDDTVRGNAALDEVFNGGDGVDTLDFRGGPAVVLALDGSFENAGAAVDDSYLNFEAVIGSSLSDRITGSTQANRLSGGGGVDTLAGGGGADTLEGGRGADVLTGGGASDVFLFAALADRGDKIGDFTNKSGNNDILHISATGFGGGLVAGALAAELFRARADNLAQDADDRFIFRTTDKTLWFDADGNGAGAAVMVADLQDTATFARADILLI